MPHYTRTVYLLSAPYGCCSCACSHESDARCDAIRRLLAALVSIEKPSRFAVAPLSFRGYLRPVFWADPFNFVIVIGGSSDVFATTALDEPLSSYYGSNSILLRTPPVATPTCPFRRSSESDIAAVSAFSP